MAYQNINKIVISSFLFTVKKNLNTIFFRVWTLLICSWAMWMIRLWFEQIVRKKTRDMLENSVFFVCFWQFVPFFMPKSKSLQSLFTHLLLFKEKIERFSPAALYKRATGAICSFSRANRSFPHKKRANRWKNRWANYQPWFFYEHFMSLKYPHLVPWTLLQNYIRIVYSVQCTGKHYAIVD